MEQVLRPVCLHVTCEEGGFMIWFQFSDAWKRKKLDLTLPSTSTDMVSVCMYIGIYVLCSLVPGLSPR